MTEREKILQRVVEALKAASPPVTHGHELGRSAGLDFSGRGARQWLPLVGPTFEDRLALFEKNAAELKAEFYLVRDLDDLAKKLATVRDAEGWKKVAFHSGELTDSVCERLGVAVCRTDSSYTIDELESADAGITECDALIAQTGSILITGRSAGGRALSVLPPHHLVLARQEQLLADLPEAFTLLKTKYSPDYPSFISFITGPSRTGDIERILVLGAHGPKKLSIFCLRS